MSQTISLLAMCALLVQCSKSCLFTTCYTLFLAVLHTLSLFPLNITRFSMEPQCHSILQFILSGVILLVVIFALEEGKLNCAASEDCKHCYSLFNTLNTLATVPLGCSIIVFMYKYAKVSNSNDGENESGIQIDKSYIFGFIFQPCLPLIFLIPACIELIIKNQGNVDCFNKGVNVSICIICDGIAVVLLLINLIINIFVCIMIPPSSVQKQHSGDIVNIHVEQLEGSEESVSMAAVEKEGETDNQYMYVDNIRVIPFVEYQHSEKGE